ncbi:MULTISPECIES: tape measure protein [unclassified Spirosoma]|uniref:tape measure protein n=1 Tax=unclassified Spirosoma TaxID=2621999 RepID=UPI00095DE571|nr:MULTISPECIES: tape measure protein [unclassified Spirosoma]MBN8820758.1 tape measure protein [Spirosoma sp.]OJW78056.1 MAG: hypothetical protein BGO59_28990 [Spirosoma sp. 48-14]
MTGTGPLSFDALINDVNFRSQLDAMERRVLGFSATTVRETDKIDASFKRLGQLAAGYFSFNALSQLPAQILKVRGEFQQLEIAFTTMLKSKAKQEALLNDLVQTAATTPFTLKDIASGAKQLLAYGSAAGQIVPELRMLGDVAAGTATPINELIYLYGTLRTQGRAYAVDIRQFAGRGIPIYQELAKVLGVNVDKVNDFVESGKVGFKQVEQAFRNMTSSGGLFAGLMDAQSKSLLGLKDRLADAWDLMLNDIGKKNEGVAANLLDTATSVVQHYQDVIDILKIAAITYGTYKSAILLVSVAQRAQLFLLQSVALEQSLAAAAGEVLTAQQARQIVVSKLLQQAQASLNATMLANPYVLVATALAALITTAFLYRQEVQQVKSASELMGESAKEVVGQFRQQSSEVKTLIGVVQNQTVAESERLKAYNRLKEIAPDIVSGLDFQKAKTADLTKALNEYLLALEKKIRLESAQNKLKEALDQDTEAAERLKKAQDDLVKQAKSNQQFVIGTAITQNGPAVLKQSDLARQQLDEASQIKKQTELVVKDIERTISGIYSGGSKDALNAQINQLELVRSKLTDKLSPAYKQVEDQLTELTKQRDALTQAENAGGTAVAKTVDYYDAEIKKAKELRDQNATSRTEYVKYQAQVDELTRARNRLTGELTKSEKKAAKEAEKSGPYGSVDYWEYVSKKAQEVLEKTSVSDTATIQKQQAIKLEADRRAEDARKLVNLKTFQEELDEKKKLYVFYERWVEAYGKESADNQFSHLLASGESYVAYLNQQIDKLDAQRNSEGLSAKEAQDLASLFDQRAEASGQKTAIERFTEELQKAGRDAVSLTNYLETLRQKQNQLDPGDTSETAIKARKLLAEQIVETERQREDELRSFLQSVSGTEQQRLSITAKYADLRAAVEKKFATNRGKAYLLALDEIDRAERDEVKEVAERTAQSAESYKKLDEVILESGRAGLKKRLAALNDYLDKEKAAINTQTYQQKLKERNDVKKSLTDDDLTRVNEFGQIVGQLGEAFAELGGTVGGVGGLLSGFASNLSLVTQAFKEDLDAGQKAQIGLQAVVNLIGIVTSAAAQRKKAEEAYYNAVIASQSEYNRLLNDQIGLQSQNNENVFSKDYIGRLKDGYKQLSDAELKYQASLKKLAEGRAKVGQENAIDWGAVGKAAASGAAIGSVIPGIGTAVGAVVGGIVGGLVGLFGGKKKQDEFGALLQTYPGLIQKGKDGVDELNKALAQTLIDHDQVDESTKQLLQDTIAWSDQVEKAREQIKGVISDLAGSLGDDLRNSLVNAFEEGTSAAQAFGDSVSKVLENVLSQLIFNEVFKSQFDQLQKEMEQSFAAGGDQSWIDDFGRFFGKADELTKLFNDGLQSAQDAAKQYGLTIFTKNNSTAQANSLSGGIKSIQEETASVLAGQINAIRIGQADTNGIIRQQLLVLNNIDRNTAGIARTNELLDSVDRRLKNIESDPLRAKGGG